MIRTIFPGTFFQATINLANDKLAREGCHPQTEKRAVKAGAARQQHSRSGAIRSRFRKCRAGEGKTRRGSMEKPTARRADPGNRGKTGKATFLRVVNHNNCSLSDPPATANGLRDLAQRFTVPRKREHSPQPTRSSKEITQVDVLQAWKEP
jgi:hypothetical protein